MKFYSRLTACLLAAGLLFTNPGAALLPELALTAYAERSVRATHSVDLKEGDSLYVDIIGSPGDEIQVRFYYLDSEGNNASSIVGALGETVLDEDGKTTVSFIAPNALNSIDIEVMYQTYPLSVSLRKESAESVASGKCGENVTWELSKSGTLTIAGSGEMNDFGILAAVPWCDYSQDKIKIAVIADGVTHIGSSAFVQCKKMEVISIPDSVTSIGDLAFYGCSGLSSIEIPAGVTTINYFAFSGCSGLTSIEIPDGLTLIESGMLSGCSGLTSIEIPDKVTYIDRDAFRNCSGLASIDIPESVNSLSSRHIKATKYRQKR